MKAQYFQCKHSLHVVNGGMARGVQDLALMLDAMTPPALAASAAGSPTTAAAVAPGWMGAPPPPPLPSSWQEIAARGAMASAPSALRVAFSNLGCAVSEEVASLCKAAANVLAAAACPTPDASSVLAAPYTVPFDLQAAERYFFVVRSSLFHGGFTENYSAGAIGSMKPEIQWNINCHTAAADPVRLMQSAMKDGKKVAAEVEASVCATTLSHRTPLPPENLLEDAAGFSPPPLPLFPSPSSTPFGGLLRPPATPRSGSLPPPCFI